MIRYFYISSLSLACMTAATSVARAAEPISFESLLHEMIDRTALARFPEPAYECAQSSSYDRDATSPDDQETWYANWDRSQFVRIEERDGRKEYVMHDADGPGALVRFWATWHGPRGGPFSNGTLRVYIDGADEPAIEGPVADVLDQGVLAGSPLSQGVSPDTPYAQRGHNLYLPIPYAKHCKVTYSTDVLVDVGAREGEALYYQINYRTYPEGTAVESFSMDRLEAAKQTVADVNRSLAESQREPGDEWEMHAADVELAAGKASEPLRIEGPGAIRELQCRLQADDVPQALRSTIVEISFDGERTIWCPLGELFGMGYMLRPYETWYTRVEADGTMSCNWVMPYEREAVVRVHNLGDQPIKLVEGEIRCSDWQWDDRSMHFHATWRQYTKIDTRGKKEMDGQNAFDLNYVTVEGMGVYVGDSLTLCSGAAAWWGEGDEKIFVDGEEFPSHFGTGTEDYYGYAWCRPEYFTSAFHAQPEGGGNLAGGYSTNNRFRALDAIPFKSSLRFDMEMWHWGDTKISYAPTTFWYARPGAESNVEPDAATAAEPVARTREDIVPVYRAPDAIEGEALKVVQHTGGKPQVQHADFGWSGDAQLWWIDGDAGDKLVIEFPVEKSGKFMVAAHLTTAVDYGVVEMSVNGEQPVKFDGFNTTVDHETVELGTFELKEGANRLTVTIVGKNPEALPRRMFGLDYLSIK